MRKTALCLLTTLIAFMAAASYAGAEEIAEGMTIPDAVLPDTDGAQRRLTDFKGHYVYLDFWASWCPPCLLSLPWMKEMEAKYGERGLKIVAVNIDNVWSEAERVIKKFEPTFLILKDPTGSLPEQFQIPVMPTSFLIDKQGKVIYRHTGFRMSDRDKLDRRIAEVLAEK